MTAEFLNKPLFSLTVGEFIELQNRTVPPTVVDLTADPSKKYVHGIAGIASIFGCSKTTAQLIKNSGKIDKAVQQLGRKIVTNAELALELAGR